MDDIFFLDIRSVMSMLSGVRKTEFLEEAMFNRASFEEEIRVPGKYLRQKVDFNSILEENEKIEQHKGRKIIGQPVASGKHCGSILVVKNLDKNVRISKGDILVTRYIDPGQTHIFLMAGALVLEVGGMLSHGAILAREFNIPTVAGVQNATDLFHDRQRAVLNGTKGTITILTEPV